MTDNFVYRRRMRRREQARQQEAGPE
jgi:hypothetical protein